MLIQNIYARVFGSLFSNPLQCDFHVSIFFYRGSVLSLICSVSVIRLEVYREVYLT